MEILVDINIAVYNHAQYLRKTLDGVLQQKALFKYRLLIGDDCSTDGSVEILKEYEKKYPDKIKVIYQPKNLGFRSTERNGLILLKNSTAKYIALLDGDDYWTDPNKLQKQVIFLEANPQISGCFHDVILVDENNKLISENYYCPHKEIFNQVDCLYWGGAYSTCSLMFRSLVFENVPDWFLKSSSDYTLDLLITEFGDIAHLPENMGAYRIHKGGIWQGSATHKNLEEVIKRYQICLTNPKFKKKYGAFFYKKIGELASSIALHYQKENKYFKRLKFTCYYIYYGRPKNKTDFNYLIGKLLFPSAFKKFRLLFSKPTDDSKA
jgi:glycosyltransferase involved in cell wall biosynthesis